MAEQWLSIVEYARTYKVSDMTVRRRIKTGKLHAVLKEGKYFIPVSAGDARGNAAAESSYDDRPASAPRRQQSEVSAMRPHPAAHKTFNPPPQRAEPRLELRHVESRHTESRHVEPRHVEHRHVEPRQSILPSPAPEMPPTRHEYVEHEMIHESGVLPASLRRPLSGYETSLVDTRALLAFCDASLRKLNENERRTVEKFKSKLETLEATIANKDLEMKALRQQVEDLQLLVKILERKKPA